MNRFWRSVLSRLKEGENVFIALVVEHSAHSPGTTGARLAMSEAGDILGTIGGGIMEYQMLDVARDALRAGTFAPRLQRLVHRDNNEGQHSGLICAGEQTNLYYLCRPEADGTAIEAAAKLQSENRPGVLTITQKGMRCQSGEPMPGLSQIVVELASDGWRYFEQLLNLKRVAIFGGGHCGLALAHTLGRLGYYVSVYETRSDLVTMNDRMPADQKHIVSDFVEAAGLVDYPELTDAVVMTTDMQSDVRALLGTIGHAFPFVGVMGSRAKIAAIRKALLSNGVTKAQLARVTAPIGLEIGSKTPEEIAVSVAAQMIRRRRRSTA